LAKWVSSEEWLISGEVYLNLVEMLILSGVVQLNSGDKYSIYVELRCSVNKQL